MEVLRASTLAFPYVSGFVTLKECCLEYSLTCNAQISVEIP